MKPILLLLVSIFIIKSATAQSEDKIETRKLYGTNQFYVNGERIKSFYLSQKLRSNPEAYKIYRSAKSSLAFGTVTGILGGGLLGYTFGKTFFSGGDIDYGLVGLGSALTLGTIGLNSLYNKQSKKAVDIYNSIKPSAMNKNNQYHLNVYPGRIGIAVTFN